MTDYTTQQSGASKSNPDRFTRWLQSKILTSIGSEKAQKKLWANSEKKRLKDNRGHVVYYFHQSQDGYSDLAVQTLKPLLERYDIELIMHLVTAECGYNAPEPDLLEKYSYTDASLIAPCFGLQSPQSMSDEAVMAIQDSYGSAAQGSLSERQDVGNQLRARLGHYSGAMFYYEGEWYWGIDRLYHLENRLRLFGADKYPEQGFLYPRPEIIQDQAAKGPSLTLEFYASLRSPYTALAYDQTVKFARKTGVNLIIKPVLPMVMRGVPATRQKGMYIFKDAAREARAQDIPYGKFYDPIGEPVKKGYSLYHWAKTHDKGEQFLSAFLNAAFVEGINTNTNNGLKTVCKNVGLDWSDAISHLDEIEWTEVLESNRLDMYEFGLWGVPSYRLLDEAGNEVIKAWGQDRLWLIAKFISKIGYL
ncbi:DsbA family protein [Temperatibacter marinus]|uniref:DsbA family protein n=1 Tax=Temperatibacter marinus TaxID=1456591 RepID=A0AA52EE18_9PROT|nr:DsbA family protein [Temperatibacter marinus]WND03000.1 DsbA family protein [Temperatibacter marinus]